ncbi:MAG: GGDEF domain-containing protein [Hylemonella sp.]|nr:GGDEF domain-containing protein [Hylemonella sp.]
MTDVHPEDVPTLSDRTLLERIRVFFGHAAGNMFSIVAAGVLIAVVLRSAGVGDTWLMAWFSALVLASVAVIFYEAWVHGQPLESVATARRLLRWRIVLGALVALLCGTAVFMLPQPGLHTEVAFLFLIVATVVTVGALSYAVVPAYYITLGLIGMAPMALYNGHAFVVSGDDFHLLLAVMAVVWLAVVLLKARRMSLTAIEAIELNERLKDAVEEQRRTKEYMSHMAMHDELTGLANRRYFEQVFLRTRSLAEREGSRFGVMSIDLNDFKPVNDRHGHAVGDVLLQTVASRLQKVIRASDFCARVGGDEFALIIDKVNADTDLDGMATKLRGVLAKPFLPLGISVATGASVGWALFPSDGNDMAPLLAVADKRMYAEKLAHRRAARARA